MQYSLGVLGVGHLASYLVAGLRAAGDKREVILSPRNVERVQYLVERFDCRSANSNQEVIERADVILLSVRPEQLESLLKPLQFRTEQLVISCVAGISVDRLSRLIGKATVVRTMPLACAEVGQGAVPLFPDHPVARDLLNSLGELILLGSEDEFELASVAACMNGWMFKFFDQLTRWYLDKGLSPEQARKLVIHACSGAAALAEAKPEQSLQHISDSIATEGTYTKLGLDLLQKSNAFDPWIDAFIEVEKALKR